VLKSVKELSHITLNPHSNNNQDNPGEKIRNIADILLSVIIIIVLSPVALIVAIIIKISGRGPVIYTQDRIGKNGKPFMIYKFRSMKFNSEDGGPLLSNGREGRVTKIGRYLRKYRIDEIPNFINVLKGEMSLVGPRPERKFFIDQIIKFEPRYQELQTIKPGITSWGQVKYGYASDINEMVDRVKYDLFYMEHRSIWFDIKILVFSIGVIIKGKGV
jgi:lipopolysaccharide/colanic/teichoic acid biosynthesis glycosyltransferase